MSLYTNKKQAILESKNAGRKVPDGVYNVLWDDAKISQGKKNPEATNISIAFKIWDKSSELHKKKITKWFAFGSPAQANEFWVQSNKGQFWELMNKLGVPIEKVDGDESLTEVFDEIKLRPPQMEVTTQTREGGQLPNVYINMDDVPTIFEEEEEERGTQTPKLPNTRSLNPNPNLKRKNQQQKPIHSRKGVSFASGN